MKLLAIESSCDETAAAVVENGRTVLSSVVASQIEEHKLYGGVVPKSPPDDIVRQLLALQTSIGTSSCHIKGYAIAVTYAPGLVSAVGGVNFAKGLALLQDYR
ncbi:MAG: hypothetical protein ACLR13_05675 [Acutalibacteraceae bacterium]